MAIDVQTDILIERPVAEVAAYAGDPSNAPDWYTNIDSVEWRTEPPVRLGSQVAFVARFLGRQLRYTYEVVELIAGERMVMRTGEGQGPFQMETTYTWTPEGDGTRMSLRNRGGPSGLARIGDPLMARAVRRATAKDLAKLKARLEA